MGDICVLGGGGGVGKEWEVGESIIRSMGRGEGRDRIRISDLNIIFVIIENKFA